MKLRQLQYVAEVASNGFSVTAAAETLFTSQPGISTQIRRLEDELGVTLFERSGKHLTGLTPTGSVIIQHVERILREVENIEDVAAERRDPGRGSLSIATTHTQARYVLPDIVKAFRERYPRVALHLHQGTPTQIAEMTASGKADLGIATEALELFDDLALLPCYRWNRCVIVPRGHPLADGTPLTLERIAEFAVITYIFGVADRSEINRAFEDRDLTMQVILTAADAEVIKTYVRTGLGVGIIARMAYEPGRDQDLTAIDAEHLFDASVTSLAIRHNTHLRGFAYEFIQLFAPHLTRSVVAQLLQTKDKRMQQGMFNRYVARTELR
ncbi:MAG: HTH-type transcriptional regulator CysB [Gammaproteobacteria bacterium]|nr:HTH-type transcriptional regulator CysB [Gammaproteobacteria bacterium]